MSHVGFFCFPGIGHLNPAIALARRLQQRGHTLTIFHSRMARPRLAAAGLGFWPLEKQNLSDVKKADASLFQIAGADLAQRLFAHARCVLHEGPSAIAAAGVEAILVDQAVLAGGSVADSLGMPYVTICFFPPTILDASVPQTIFPWAYRNGPLARTRNRMTNALIRAMLRPVMSEINKARYSWNLPSIRTLNEVNSRLAMISQMPEHFDFPREVRYHNLFYTGPFRDTENRKIQEFPWERLNGRPLIYASLGTVRNKMPRVFQLIAEACTSLDVQLVISLGGGSLTPDDLGTLPGDPVVVHYAPQIELLQKASLTITHAGLNTTLESLAEGVPIVAVPLADDQPGVAARIKWSGVGKIINPRSLTVNALRTALQETMTDTRYRHAAQAMKLRIGIMDGASAAAKIAENVLNLVPMYSDLS